MCDVGTAYQNAISEGKMMKFPISALDRHNPSLLLLVIVILNSNNTVKLRLSISKVLSSKFIAYESKLVATSIPSFPYTFSS